MAWDDYSGNGGWFDLNNVLSGSDSPTPLPDVSDGSPAMETSTPTGNGSGVFVDSSLQSQIFGGLSKVLDYAMMRDQQQMQRLPGMQGYGGITQQQVYQQQRAKNNFLFLALVGVGIFALAKA